MQTPICGLLCAITVLVSAARAEETHSKSRAFFAFDNGLRQTDGLEEKAALLAQLGYDGIAWRPGKTAAMLAALDRHELKMFATYVTLSADEEACRVPPGVVREIHALKGRETIVWLTIGGKSTRDDVVVEGIQRVCDVAEENGLRVALYPHNGYYTDTTAKALELAQKARRPNLGVSFNLCHFLKQNDASQLEETLRAAADQLLLVSINGADGGETRRMGWDRLIRPLGEGSYDVAQVLHVLDAIGYTGPVGLQCFNVKGDDRNKLRQSKEAWRSLTDLAPQAASRDSLDVPQDERIDREIQHVTVRCEPGQFLGWPANGGIWNWGDEILVMYTHGLFKQDARGMHAIDRETPWTIDASRSLDGGLTWTHQTDVIPNPRYEDVRDAPELTEPIDFSDPDTVLKFQLTHWTEGRTYLFYSTDRGRTWRGPFRLPTLGFDVVAARNDYLIDDADTCTAFWSMSRSPGERDSMVYLVRSNDGGLSWELGARVGRETQSGAIDYAIMPSTVRTGSKELLTCIRNRVGLNDCFIDCWASSDHGSTWLRVSRPVGNEAGTTPPMLNRLPDGDLLLTYGYRKPPQGLRARISHDNGRTWGPEIILRQEAGPNRDIGYTRSVIRADGKIVTVYYYNLGADQERFIAATIWDASERQNDPPARQP